MVRKHHAIPLPIFLNILIERIFMSRQYYVINALNGAVQIITSKSRYKVAEKAKRIFGNAPLHIYAR